jgi:quercetin dioxygenase-like cupin family protein
LFLSLLLKSMLNKIVKMKKYLKIFLMVVIYALCAPAFHVVAQETNNPANEKKFTIENCVTSFSMDSVVKTSVGYQFWFVDKNFLDGRTLKMSVVKPGSATHPPHKHAEDEFFFVLEGTAEFYLDGQTRTAAAYASFYCPSNVEHGIRNVGDTDLKYLVIKKYEIKM